MSGGKCFGYVDMSEPYGEFTGRSPERVGEFSEVMFDGRWIGPHGIGRFATEVLRRLPGASSYDGDRPFFLTPLDPVLSSFRIRQRRPAVYFTPGFNPPIFSRMPFVVTLHDLIHLSIPEEGSVLKNAFYEQIVKPALFRAFRVLTVSGWSKGKILEWSGLPEERVVVVGNGVGGDFSPVGDRYMPGFPYFLYVGNRKPHKNLPFLMAAFSKARLPSSVKIAFSGDPDERTIFGIRECNLQDRVVFLGELSDAALASSYRGALALLFPSRIEGFGLPVLEALACGTRVLASRIPAVEEVAGTSARLLSPDDPEEWSRALEEVSDFVVGRSGDRSGDGGGESSDPIREAGIVRARLYSWNAVGERVGAVLRQAMKAKG